MATIFNLRHVQLLTAAMLVCMVGRVNAGDGPTSKPANGADDPLAPAQDVAKHRKLAKSTVYVIDATGSMLSDWQELTSQLNRVIGSLDAAQSFNVVLSNDHDPEPLATALIHATPENKKKAGDYFATTTPHGGPDPLPALQKAFALKPEAIFFFTDPTCFPDKKAMLELVNKAENKDVRIDIIAFEGHDADNEEFLQSVAKQSGGFYKYVSATNLTSDGS